jgi:acyl dehydratase
MAIVYFDDLKEGSIHWGSECLVDKDEMLDYNRRNDPWPFHVDEDAAKHSPFGGLIASGGYIITLAYRSTHAIYNTAEVTWAFQGGLDWHVKFHLPVRPGDRLRSRITMKSKRPSSKAGRGIVTSANDLTNQEQRVVFSNEVVFIMATRPR